MAEKAPKKKHKGIIAVILVLILLVGAGFLYSNVTTANTYNRFIGLHNTMAEGAVKAEPLTFLSWTFGRIASGRLLMRKPINTRRKTGAAAVL